MSRRPLERKRIIETMKNMSSLANKGGVTGKPQICNMSPTLDRPYNLEMNQPYDRSLWKNECDSVVDIRGFDHQPLPCYAREPSNVRAKQTPEKKKKINNIDNKLAVSMQNLSLGIKTIPIARAVTKKPKARAKVELASYFRRNIGEWTEKVFLKVGPDQKEIKYQVALKELLLSKGFIVASEATQKFEVSESKPIIKRADLIVSVSGVIERVLIECKAKKKLEKKDHEQVLFYQHHFGISECYLINFRIGTEVKRVKERTARDKTRNVAIHVSQHKKNVTRTIGISRPHVM